MTGPQAVRVVGGLVPPGLFARVQTRDVREAASLAPTSYGLSARETIRDAANRSWTYLRGAWADWREHAAGQPGGVAGAGPTRDRWLLVLVRELGYGQLPPLKGGLEVDGVGYPVSHLWLHVPIHLLGSGVDLDRRNPGVTGAARAPQSMVQELLNRSEPHLWALLSNGLRLRVLRDSTSLAGSAYVEFDLEAIFDGELFAEFLLLWQVCHVSRFAKRGDADAPPSDCWLEAWRGEAVDGGTRALNQLRDGVEKAIIALGTGFLRHPGNRALIDALRSGRLTREQYHRALLRLVYRLLFLSVAEARGVLLHGATPEIIDRYTRFYSVARLRALSRVRAGGPHGDLWQGLTVVLGALGGAGLPALGLPALAGLFDPADTPLDDLAGAPVDHLLGWELANHDLLTAMRHLGWLAGRGPRVQPVDYRNLGAEELGSVYESLLELVPRLDLPESTFTLEAVAGNERKTTGSYYTPASLVSALLDSALDPLLDDAVKNAVDNDDAVRRLLAITVCDPACGSGHFLVAAARRIARRVAQLRSGDEEPSPAEVQHALREVVGSCIYGVDVNPFAAELAKVSLWMEALEPGKPLGFLDARIRVGNSLLGTTPALLAQGVPDAAFKELEGDDKEIAAATRKLNKKERTQRGIYESGVSLPNSELAERRAHLVALADVPDAVRTQAKAWQWYDRSHHQLVLQRTQADAWCAAFVWNLVEDGPEAPTTAIVHGLATSPNTQPERTRAEIARLAREYAFFHWHLEFPEVFPVTGDTRLSTRNDGWSGGFSCVLGNPPWDRIAFEDETFFSQWAPEVLATDTTHQRKEAIQALLVDDSETRKAYYRARRRVNDTSLLVGESGRYPLTARGRLTTQGPFAELATRLVRPEGRLGMILPTGVFTDVPMKDFWEHLVNGQMIRMLVDFENRREIFQNVHRSYKFALFAATATRTTVGHRKESLRVGIFFEDPAELENPDRLYEVPLDALTLLNPKTKQLPLCRTARDAEILLRLTKAAQPGLPVRPWVGFTSEGHSKYFESEASPSNTPIWEGKMIHKYDAAFATYRGVSSVEKRAGKPQSVATTAKADEIEARHYCPSDIVDQFLERRDEKNQWVYGVRDYVRSTDEYTAIATALPRSVPVQPLNGFSVAGGPQQGAWALAAINSLAYDFAAKQKTPGQHFNVTIMSQIPVPAVVAEWLPFIVHRVAELSCTNTSLNDFGVALGISRTSLPFHWHDGRRAQLRADIDALFFHLYGLTQDDVTHVLGQLSVLRRKEEKSFGEFRTGRLTLAAFERLAPNFEKQALHA